MILPPDIRIFGDINWRGACPVESLDQITFFNWLRRQHPKTWGMLALHPRNEGRRTMGQVSRQKAEGMTAGASDIIIPARISFVCELKRKDHTQCSWQPGQQDYLRAAQDAGAFVCVALGWEAGKEALEKWLTVQARS